MADTRFEDLAEELYAARSLEAEGVARPVLLAFADIHAFLSDPAVKLAPQQQALLFSDPKIRAGYLRLKQQATLAQVPVAIAASTSELSRRTLSGVGGTIEIRPSRVGRQVYVIIRPEHRRLAPRVLLMESESGLIARTALPEPDDQGNLMLLKDLDVAEDSQLIELIQDPTATGALLT